MPTSHSRPECSQSHPSRRPPVSAPSVDKVWHVICSRIRRFYIILFTPHLDHSSQNVFNLYNANGGGRVRGRGAPDVATEYLQYSPWYMALLIATLVVVNKYLRIDAPSNCLALQYFLNRNVAHLQSASSPPPPPTLPPRYHFPLLCFSQ